MKKSIIKVSALAVLLAATSCSKDILNEQPRSVLVPSFLGTPEGVQAGLVGVYSGMRNVFGNEEAMYMAVQGTDEFMRGIQAAQGYEDYDQGRLNSSNPASTNQWGIIYRYINDANAVIQYASSVQGLSPAVLAQIVAEAKVLRAQYYFLLVQFYGDVPLTLKFVDAPTKDFTRAPKADVYNAIIADLNDALGTIADRSAQPGRVTRATALHLLSKVHLTRATSTAKQGDDYAKAAQYATELISPAGQARYSVGLETDVANVFREGNENGREVLMNVQFNTDPSFTGTDPFSPTGANQTNFFFRTRYDQLPNMVRDIPNGRPYARFIPTPFLLNSYILPGEAGKQLRSTDSRYNKWFTTVWYVNSPGANSGRATAVVGDTAVWYTGRPLTAAELARIAARPQGPYTIAQPANYTTQYSPVLNKYDDRTRTGVNNPSDRPLIVYRLAETFLIAAEANMYLGNMGAAVANINEVRRRAADTPAAKTRMEITAGQLNIDFILDERSRELAGEQMRWFDLVRTGKLIQRVQAHVPPFVPSKTSPTGGTDSYGSDAAKNIVLGRTPEQFLLRPIPQQEIDRTGGKITQNPGYL